MHISSAPVCRPWSRSGARQYTHAHRPALGSPSPMRTASARGLSLSPLALAPLQYRASRRPIPVMRSTSSSRAGCAAARNPFRLPEPGLRSIMLHLCNAALRPHVCPLPTRGLPLSACSRLDSLAMATSRCPGAPPADPAPPAPLAMPSAHTRLAALGLLASYLDAARRPRLSCPICWGGLHC